VAPSGRDPTWTLRRPSAGDYHAVVEPQVSPRRLRAFGSHGLGVAGVLALIAFAMLLPFLPGTHDRLAATVSLSAQLIGVVGLLFVPVGGVWLAYELRKRRHIARNLLYTPGRHRFALATVVVGSVTAGVIALAACAAATISFGVLVLLLSAYVLYRLTARVVQARSAEDTAFSAVPIYLTFVPIATLLLQLSLAGPATAFSRNRAIEASASLIAGIDAYRATHAVYPESLLGTHKDYNPSVVGIERYEYARRGETYDLAFEQPLFLLDDIGTREWVVYNPRDEHFLTSHVAWNLEWAPHERPQQGFVSHDAGAVHWRRLRFD
jgi:hypothetical protein